MAMRSECSGEVVKRWPCSWSMSYSSKELLLYLGLCGLRSPSRVDAPHYEGEGVHPRKPHHEHQWCHHLFAARIRAKYNDSIFANQAGAEAQGKVNGNKCSRERI